jgi:hypothetical protein
MALPEDGTSSFTRPPISAGNRRGHRQPSRSWLCSHDEAAGGSRRESVTSSLFQVFASLSEDSAVQRLCTVEEARRRRGVVRCASCSLPAGGAAAVADLRSRAAFAHQPLHAMLDKAEGRGHLPTATMIHGETSSTHDLTAVISKSSSGSQDVCCQHPDNVTLPHRQGRVPGIRYPGKRPFPARQAGYPGQRLSGDDALYEAIRFRPARLSRTASGIAALS